MTRGPTPEEFFAQEFAARKKAWDAGRHYPDLHYVVHLAGANSVPLPEWAALEVLGLIVACHNATGKKRSQCTLDHIHMMRWSALTVAFRARGIEKYKKTPGRPKEARGIQEAREEASKGLRGNIAFGTPRQIQDSFDKVEKVRGTAAEARYFLDRL